MEYRLRINYRKIKDRKSAGNWKENFIRPADAGCWMLDAGTYKINNPL
jgi:hypothetical protein